jgi:hypothetical protein
MRTAIRRMQSGSSAALILWVPGTATKQDQRLTHQQKHVLLLVSRKNAMPLGSMVKYLGVQWFIFYEKRVGALLPMTSSRRDASLQFECIVKPTEHSSWPYCKLLLSSLRNHINSYITVKLSRCKIIFSYVSRLLRLILAL